MSERVFLTSSHSGATTQNREVGVFRTSTPSGAVDQSCGEVAALPDGTLVRDSRNPHRGHLAMPPNEWTAFLHNARRRQGSPTMVIAVLVAVLLVIWFFSRLMFDRDPDGGGDSPWPHNGGDSSGDGGGG
ncbi:DUF397 domain-containing protein [Nocardiopsis sp. CT-R113]|uniref:DUF397 domain-containing protein n=1 Tax=Nocardiopsis codii TaxID=3065942 RepID=A0ABU7KFE5_9ACTN|nr:DUF397 domain-containing protein [Nocardiopsis sp. CT-R113]MEE2040963.1 DUF397 domain-containing protein [Nocardiopsis sp. CT-R113]